MLLRERHQESHTTRSRLTVAATQDIYELQAQRLSCSQQHNHQSQIQDLACPRKITSNKGHADSFVDPTTVPLAADQIVHWAGRRRFFSFFLTCGERGACNQTAAMDLTTTRVAQRCDTRISTYTKTSSGPILTSASDHLGKSLSLSFCTLWRSSTREIKIGTAWITYRF